MSSKTTFPTWLDSTIGWPIIGRNRQTDFTSKDYVLPIPVIRRSCVSSILLLMVCVIGPTSSLAQSIKTPPTRPDDLPRNAHWMRALSSDECDVFRDGRTLWLVPTEVGMKAKQCRIPRLCASLTAIGWKDQAKLAIKFTPEPEHWDFSWKQPASENARIQVVFETEPILPAQNKPSQASADGSILLTASQATTTGEKLRFEPQWFKNTVGYWTNPDDYATWNVKFEEAGDYSVAILQGCGAGHGGSDALLSLRGGDVVVAQLPFQPIDTGHFQNFRWLHLGRISVKQAGILELRINPIRIRKGALCDIRAIQLVKQAK